MKRLAVLLALLAVSLSAVACASAQGPAATVLQVYTRVGFTGISDPFPNVPLARRGEEIIVAGAGFKSGETVRIHVQKILAATSTAQGDTGLLRLKFTVPLEIPATGQANVYRQAAVEAVGDKGSRAIATIMLGQ